MQGVRSGKFPCSGPGEALPAHIAFQTRSSVLEPQLSFQDGQEATTLLCSYIEAHTSLRTSQRMFCLNLACLVTKNLFHVTFCLRMSPTATPRMTNVLRQEVVRRGWWLSLIHPDLPPQVFRL